MTQAIFAPVDVELASDIIHVAFQCRVHRRAADTAHRAGRWGVGIDQLADGAELADTVIDRAAMEREGRHIGHLAGISAVIHISLDIAGEDIAVTVEGRAHLDDSAFAAIGGDQILDPVVGQLDRLTAAGLGERGGVRLDAVIELATETAADRMADDAHIAWRDIHELRHSSAHVERELMAGMDSKTPVAVNRDGALRFKIGLVLALAGEFILNHQGCAIEYRVDTAGIGTAFGGDIAITRKIAAVRRHIVLPIGMNQRRVRPAGGFKIEHRRARRDFYLNHFGGGMGLGQTVRRHCGDGLADITHPVAREERRIEHAPASQRLWHVGGAYDRAHAGHGARLGEVEAHQLAGGNARAQQEAVQHAGFLIVIGVDRLATRLAPSVGADCRAANMVHDAGAFFSTTPRAASTICA